MIWVLTGFMGCGKTTIGRLVARMAAVSAVSQKKCPPATSPERGELRFVDLDEEIVLREGRSIPEIFADGGEAAFRAVERTTLAGLLSEADGNLLISLGGGTLTDPESRALVHERCRCIYLRASVETLAANLRWEGESASRPMLAGADPEAPAESPDSLESRIAAMMATRGPIYETAADFILDIDTLSYEAAAEKVLYLTRRALP